ncbi:MAG: DUF4153 domain-containing protein [Paludibacteraceae bacterium]|nr:DUF4153 domain-containing protein [Paludibacteraceae bacterium]
MEFLRRIQKKLAEFCASISQFPVETALCLFAFVLSVALCEMYQRNWMEDSYFFKRFAPVSLLYVAAVFSIAFSIRMRRRKPVQQRKINVVYWLSGLLVLIPQFFFQMSDFGDDPCFVLGVYLLSFLLMFAIRGQKDNGLFVSDAYKLVASLITAAVLSAIIAMVYYAIMASFFYLFLPDYFRWKFLIYRILFSYVGFFFLAVLAPLLFCYCAKVVENKNTALIPKALDVVLAKILTPALVCYTLILFLYAAKVVATWSLPRGGVAWMVVAYLVVAFVVYMLQPFLSKTRLSFFFKYLPFISVVPLALFWVGIVRRISDYGLTESRVFIAAFGLLMMLFFAFSLLKRLNCYLLMAGMAAVAVFFLMLVPPTSARSLTIISQQKRVDAFLAKYPIYNESTKSFVPVAEIPDECLRDTVERKRFVSALRCLDDLRGFDTAVIRFSDVPDELANFYKEKGLYMSFYCHNIPVADFPYVSSARCLGSSRVEVDGTVVFEYDEDAYLEKYRSVLKNAFAGKEQIPEEFFWMKNDSVLVMVNSVGAYYYPRKDSLEYLDMTVESVVFSKKPLPKRKIGSVGLREMDVIPVAENLY